MRTDFRRMPDVNTDATSFPNPHPPPPQPSLIYRANIWGMGRQEGRRGGNNAYDCFFHTPIDTCRDQVVAVYKRLRASLMTIHP